MNRLKTADGVKLVRDFEFMGIECCILGVNFWECQGRMYGGHYMGYVKLPENHRHHGSFYSKWAYSDGFAAAEITFSEEIDEPGNDGWWIGFSTYRTGGRPEDTPIEKVRDRLVQLAAEVSRDLYKQLDRSERLRLKRLEIGARRRA